MISALQISLVRQQQMKQKQQLKIFVFFPRNELMKLVTKSQRTMKKTYFHIENSLNLDRVCWCHLRITHAEIDVNHLEYLLVIVRLFLTPLEWQVTQSTTNNDNMLFMVFSMPLLRKLVARPLHRAEKSLARSELHTTNFNAISKQVPCLS